VENSSGASGGPADNSGKNTRQVDLRITNCVVDTSQGNSIGGAEQTGIFGKIFVEIRIVGTYVTVHDRLLTIFPIFEELQPNLMLNRLQGNPGNHQEDL
jgi:hypothetical protein